MIRRSLRYWFTGYKNKSIQLHASYQEEELAWFNTVVESTYKLRKHSAFTFNSRRRSDLEFVLISISLLRALISLNTKEWINFILLCGVFARFWDLLIFSVPAIECRRMSAARSGEKLRVCFTFRLLNNNFILIKILALYCLG